MTRRKTRAFCDSYWGEEETENNVDGAWVRRETRNVSETSVGIACR